MRPLHAAFALVAALAAVPAHAAPAAPDPALDALVALVTDGKAISALRGKNVIARLSAIVAVKEKAKEEFSWSFAGASATGVVAAAELDFHTEGGNAPLESAAFRLRAGAPGELFRDLAARLGKKLGRPVYVRPKKKPKTMGWDLGHDWAVSLYYPGSKADQVDVVIEEWREEEGG